MNKKILLTSTALFLALAACHNPLKGVDQELLSNAEGYINAMANYDFEAARPYATEETNNITLNFFEKFMMPKIDSAFIAQNTPATIHIDSVNTWSDTSATVFFSKKTPIQSSDASLDMRRRNGQWLAHQVIDPTIRFGNSPKTE